MIRKSTLKSLTASLKKKGLTPLQAAVLSGKPQLVRSFIQSGADVNEKDVESGTTPIFCAITNKDTALIKLLVSEGADLSSRANTHDYTPLATSTELNDVEGVKCLLDLGADIHERVANGDSVLHIAAVFGAVDVAKLLLERGLDVDIRNSRKETPLHSAAMNSSNEVLKVLLANGANMNAGSSSLLRMNNSDREFPMGHNCTALYLASQLEHVETVRILIEAGADLNIQSGRGYNPLHAPAISGPFKIAKMLIDAGIDVNARTQTGRSALSLAAKGGKVKLVEALLNVEGINIDNVDVRGETPLTLAARSGHFSIVKLLVAKGAAINGHHKPSDRTALHMAICCNQEDIVKFLVENGAEVGPMGDENETSLHHACYAGPFMSFKSLSADIYGVRNLIIADGEDPDKHTGQDNPELVKYLVKCGADPNRADNRLFTPLHCAAMNGWFKIAKYLVTVVKNINQKTAGGATALHLAAIEGHHKVVDSLLRNGADSSIADFLGQKPLDEASHRGHDKVVQLLVKHHADVNDAEGLLAQTPLFSAVSANNIQMALSLLGKGADANALNGIKQTPLHVACKEGHEDMIKLLLKYGANPDVRDAEKGHTPLFIAVESKSLNLVQTLLEYGADVNVANNCGVLPIHVATRKSSTDIAIALLNHGSFYNVEAQARNYTGLPMTFARKTKNAKLITTLELIKNLFKASMKDDSYQIGCCIQAGAILNARKADGTTVLHYGVSNDNGKIIKSLLKRGADITLATSKGDLPLHIAAAKGNEEVLSVLLSHVQQLNPTKRNKVINAATTESGATALHVAAEKNNLKVMQLLFQNGAVYNPRSKNGKTPSGLSADPVIQNLCHSVEKLFGIVTKSCDAAEDVAQILKADKSIVNARDFDGGGTPLYWSAAKGHTNIVTVLLDNAADCSLVTHKGTSPLHIAASKGHTKIVQAITDKVRKNDHNKASLIVDAVTTKGTTPLHIAANKEIVCCLLESGATYNPDNEEGKTPEEVTKIEGVRKLLKATHQIFTDIKGGVPEVMAKLNRLKADELKAVFGTRNEEGQTLLQVVQASAHAKLASKLIMKMRLLE